MVHLLATLVIAATSITAVSAHAGPAPVHWRRDNHVARDLLEENCGAQLAVRRAKRNAHSYDRAIAKRAPAKRNLAIRQTSTNDSTCILTPEVTEGPYHILGEIVRQNITENQAGVPLEVSVDFVDIETCEPVQVWVDAWHANATGYYAGYIAETGAALSGGSGTGGAAPSGSGAPGGSSGVASSTSTASTTVYTYGPYDGADAESAASMLNTDMDDNSTFLRGVWQSDEDGHLTMYSVVPGWYSGRATHFHIKAYPDGYIATNGTFVANSSAVHTGQFFFDEDTLEQVAVVDSYASNSIDWSDHVTNDADQWYPYQDSYYNAIMDITWVGSDITDGLIGSIAVGLNMSYASIELSTQYAAFDVDSYEASSMLPYASASASA